MNCPLCWQSRKQVLPVLSLRNQKFSPRKSDEVEIKIPAQILLLQDLGTWQWRSLGLDLFAPGLEWGAGTQRLWKPTEHSRDQLRGKRCGQTSNCSACSAPWGGNTASVESQLFNKTVFIRESKVNCSCSVYCSADSCINFKGMSESAYFALEIAGLKLLLLENEVFTFCWNRSKSPRNKLDFYIKLKLFHHLKIWYSRSASCHPSSSFYSYPLPHLTFRLNLFYACAPHFEFLHFIQDSQSVFTCIKWFPLGCFTVT